MSILVRISTMPRDRQILLAAGALVIAAFVAAAAYFVFLRQPDSVLFSNLRAMDAATIVADLDKKKVPYHLADGGTTILVAKDQVDATRLSILSEDLPLKGTVGFELFNKSDIGLTEFAQKINYQRALQGELARTIMAVDGVDTARVHLSLPDATIFQDDKRAPKASIALAMKPGKPLAPGAVRGIQRLVAAAVPDLDVGNVVVLDGEGQVISSDVVAVDTAVDAPSSETPAQHAAEVYYGDKVRQALDGTYPDHDFAVRVTARPADATSSGAPGDGAFSGWTPEDRKFPLTVSIGDAAARDADTQRNIRVATAAAIGENPDLGDQISVTTQGPAAPAPVGDYGVNTVDATAHAARNSVPAEPSKFPWPAFWISMAVAIAVGAGAAYVQIRRSGRQPRKLTEAERQDFADRFRVLLEGGEGDAADPL
jgi:flagellar M-ring protein FliF